jgi:hypothetical protein
MSKQTKRQKVTHGNSNEPLHQASDVFGATHTSTNTPGEGNTDAVMEDAPLEKSIKSAKVPERPATLTTTSAPENDDGAEKADAVPKKKRVYRPREKKVKVPKQVAEVDEDTRLQARATGMMVHPYTMNMN